MYNPTVYEYKYTKYKRFGDLLLELAAMQADGWSPIRETPFEGSILVAWVKLKSIEGEAQTFG